MSNPNIFIFAEPDQAAECNAKLEKYGCALTKGQAGWHTPQGDNEDEMIGHAKDADALLGTSIRSSPITRRIMEANPNLRVVAKCTVGTDDVDVEAATELGILVTHAPTESNCYGVAEGAVTMILSMLKKQTQRDASVKAGKWRDPGLMGTYLGKRTTDGYPGITLGIIGIGRIGARVAQLFAPWRMRIVGYDPYIADERFIVNGVQKVEFDTLLAESDVVTMHALNTKETRHMMGKVQFARMKKTAIFVNTARGANVDEAAMAEALANDTIAGAAIDAFEDEPLPKDSPLRGLGDKVLLSAHMVSSNQASGLGPGYKWATDAVLQVLEGRVPNNVFNPEAIDRWKERFGGRSVLTVNEPAPVHPGYGPPNP